MMKSAENRPRAELAEPLDRPIVEENLEDGQSEFYRKLNTNFGTTYYGDVSQSETAWLTLPCWSIASGRILTGGRHG